MSSSLRSSSSRKQTSKPLTAFGNSTATKSSGIACRREGEILQDLMIKSIVLQPAASLDQIELCFGSLGFGSASVASGGSDFGSGTNSGSASLASGSSWDGKK